MMKGEIRYRYIATAFFLMSIVSSPSAAQTNVSETPAMSSSLAAMNDETTATSTMSSSHFRETAAATIGSAAATTTFETTVKTTLPTNSDGSTPTTVAATTLSFNNTASSLSFTNGTTSSLLSTSVATPSLSSAADFSTPSISLNVSSIIDAVTNSNESRVLLMNFNLTLDIFYENLVNYTLSQPTTAKEIILNSTEGQILLEILRANASRVLGVYVSRLTKEAEQVFFYALLLDFLQNLNQESYIEDFIQATIYGNENSTYSLKSERLTDDVCRIYINAGGLSTACTVTTSTTISTQSTDIPVAIIVGCVVGGGALLIITIAVIGYFCTKTSASKVTPTDELESSRPDSKNCFGNDSPHSVDERLDSNLQNTTERTIHS